MVRIGEDLRLHKGHDAILLADAGRTARTLAFSMMARPEGVCSPLFSTQPTWHSQPRPSCTGHSAQTAHPALAIMENANVLARYASICQQVGLQVPQQATFHLICF